MNLDETPSEPETGARAAAILGAEQRAYVDWVVEDVPFLGYNAATGTFDVDKTDEKSDVTWDELKLLYRAVRRLREEPPPAALIRRTPVSEIETGYYVRCLEHYCHQRLDLGIGHDDTCWVRNAGLTHGLGRRDPESRFDDTAKEAFMEALGERKGNYIALSIYRAYRRDPTLIDAVKMDAEGWVMFRADIPIRPTAPGPRLKLATKELVKRAIGFKRDRVLKVVRSIERHGWDEDLARKPLSGVMGYSRSTGQYHVFTGKHRIAALRYLYSRGRIDGATQVPFPVITYPWGAWRQHRPHPDTRLCDACRALCYPARSQ